MRFSKLFQAPEMLVEKRPEQTSHNRPIYGIVWHLPALVFLTAGAPLLRVWATLSLFYLSYLAGFPLIRLFTRQLS